MNALAVQVTPIPGLLLVRLPVHGDNRGWFKENWQRRAMAELGLPDFGPVQNNVSFNATAGTTRGIHAEPWDKFVSVAAGRAFGAWVDLREGPGFGRLFTTELDPGTAVFVPRGVGNAFQTLADNTVYSYLVNEHWSASAKYTFLNLADETVAVPWPIPLERAELSEKDRGHPRLAEVVPVPPRRILVLGADGQLGRALREEYDGDSGLGPGSFESGRVEFAGRDSFDLASPEALASRDWNDYEAIINAAAFTAVDDAETPEGRRAAWEINTAAIVRLARTAVEHRLLLVHVSSDYVFDGSVPWHRDDEPWAPLSVYGQSKAAGEAAVAVVPRHYLVRSSWVVGEGRNFVRTMASLAAKGARPAVVNDQFGRLTFAQDLAAGIRHLIDSKAPYGSYNLSNSGPVQSWAEIAAEVYELCGRARSDVTGVSSAEYFRDKHGAPRPSNSALDLSRIESAGFFPPPASERLREYVSRL
ncbi:dTDP-4-dehydrorhamnose reductase [Arthrobacter sp. SW1]|uniref:sugar nucleotide-binding protein n=1 Tax=Arthrobacter sp. SW1 TaxID=1920889 RepID=UPI000877C8BE|nr:bifunctional dTDP-4-dehydrorhamnose 3,5-epimerase family protein/NAD(P)-dependent oxidoreductase [Arthrobacter sp. SW1]OFI37284.1 dTDP-4-dehydrorhamnose reductase [Arthrobacter sp. SW1]